MTDRSKEFSWLTTHSIHEGEKSSQLPVALGIATQKVTCAMDDQQAYNAVISFFHWDVVAHQLSSSWHLIQQTTIRREIAFNSLDISV